jgi:cephalosporin hydroxylase
MASGQLVKKLYRQFLAPTVHSLFFRELISKTKNFGTVTWMGHPIWQNVFDLQTIQETIVATRPSLLIECGTNRGGSSMFYAHLFDLMGNGEVITVDVERLHNLSHPRITYLIGSSTASEVLEVMRQRAGAAVGPVMVILDSDHSANHVRQELSCYASLVTPGSFCLVQDGVIDKLPPLRAGRPGPLVAIEDFLRTTDEFEVDNERCERFLITHHPKGWLRRKSTP